MAISFDEAPLWDSASLEAALVREALQPLQLTLTDNRSVLLSFCRKRGPLWAYYKPESFTLMTARDRVATYQWRSYTIHHHHCPICGCGTYTESPVWVEGKPHPTQRQIGVNARLFDEFDLEKVPVEVLDGKNLW